MGKLFEGIAGPNELVVQGGYLLQRAVEFLVALTSLPGYEIKYKPVYDQNSYLSQNIQFVLKQCQLANILPFMISLLLNQGVIKQNTTVRSVPQFILGISVAGFRMLNNIGRFNLKLLQECICSDLVFHLTNFVIQYCQDHMDNGPQDVRELLHECILFLGYFVLQNGQNQAMMARGETTILQKLCNLPFNYFSDQKLINVLYPTLISVCFQSNRNSEILTQEMSTNPIQKYIHQMIKSCQEEVSTSGSRQGRALSISSNGSSNKSYSSMLAAVSQNLTFVNRFPKELWEDTVKWFNQYQ